MENQEGVNINLYMYEWLKFIQYVYETNNNTNVILGDLDFKDSFYLYLSLRNINKTNTLSRIEISTNKFNRWVKDNETFKLCMLCDKENMVYCIYGKSNGYNKWIVNKKKYPCLLNIISYLEEKYKYNNNDNVLIKMYDETLNEFVLE